MKPVNELPKEIEVTLTRWGRTYRFWRVLHYTVGVLGVVASTLGASGEVRLGLDTAGWSAIAGVCVGTLAFLNPLSTYDQFVRAWRRLNLAVLRFRYGLTTTDQLFAAYGSAEDLIGGKETSVAGLERPESQTQTVQRTSRP